MGNIFIIIFYNPLLNALIAFYHLMIFLHIPNALGFAIIALTIAIRSILAPLTAAQLRTSKKMQALSPHLSRLKEKHKNDAKMLQQEQMRLYKEHGVNPLSGCLPLLLQLPVIWALYSVLQLSVNSDTKHVMSVVNSAVYSSSLKLTHPIDQHFFGLPLGQSPSHLLSSVGLVIFLFPLATAVFQLIQSKMMFATPEPLPGVKKSNEEEFAQTFQTQSLYIFPLMIGFFSYSLPLGLSLYWNTFTIFGIIQQYLISGWGSLPDWLPFLKNK